jgi:hypothetical protein
MTKFSPIDQSVPAPEFGAGAVIRFTLSDLERLESWADQSLAVFRSENAGSMIAGLTNWMWIDTSLVQSRARQAREILRIALKQDDHKTKLVLPDDVDEWPRHNLFDLCNKLTVALVASLEGLTIEESRTKLEEQRLKAVEEMSRPAMAGEDILSPSGDLESAPA